MCKKRQPTSRVNWTVLAGSSSTKATSADINRVSNGAANGQLAKRSFGDVQSLMFSPNWTVVKARDNFYGEYHGTSCPEELDSQKDGMLSGC